MALDLNNSLDFAKLTSSTAQGLLTAFGRDPREWDILEASYNGVVFHVFESQQTYQASLPRVTDRGGRRKVEYRFPYLDGQTTDDLGAMPETFDMEVVLFGNRYKKALVQLFAELNKPQPGTLVHPVRGKLICVMKTFELVHEHSARNAVALRLTMVQHTFTIASFGTVKEDKTVKGWLGRALDAFKTIDDVIDKVESTVIFTQQLKNNTLGLLDQYKNLFAATLGKMNNSFNKGGSVDLPTLKPVNEGGAVGADGEAFDTAALVMSPSEAFAGVPAEDIFAEAGIIDTIEAENEVNQIRADVDEIIEGIESGAGGLGALEFHDEIVSLKETAITMQRVMETGVASSQYKIVEYVTPRVMSIREVAFENGLSVDSVEQLEILNPSLLSFNYIEKETTLKVAVNQ